MSLTHFANKAFIIIFDESTGVGCRRYGIQGIYNKKSIAEIALAKLNEEILHDHRMSISYNIKEVSLNDKTALFSYYY